MWMKNGEGEVIEGAKKGKNTEEKSEEFNARRVRRWRNDEKGKRKKKWIG